ncbi:hypothetical protein M422DRAFT_45885 [Sphaerobolus stellatus SS14]|nr:hypothetical protein M422DRAFT_45885 [Sphaerobolus stellatus SS14]
MLRNCSPTFIHAASAKKFLEALEDVLTAPGTSPVVRERLFDVLAAAAYTHPGSPREGYRVLWRKIKPPNKPEEGIPFDDDEAMLNPAPPQPRPSPALQNQVIPIHEDMRRLFEECVVAKGNATLLNESLTFATPEDLASQEGVINEWYRKCNNSREFIMAQIPWATAQADRSREEIRGIYLAEHPGVDPAQISLPTTREEELLAALLAALEDLQEAFRIYEDLERLGWAEMEEKEVQERSRKETRMDRSQLQYMDADGVYLDTPGRSHAGGAGAASSAGPSRSPSPSHALLPLPSTMPPVPPINQSLAPPRATPHGPRPPARTPSPDRLSHSQTPSQVSLLPPSLTHTHIPGLGTGHVPTGSLGIDVKRLADLTFDDKGSLRERDRDRDKESNGKGKGKERERRSSRASTSTVTTSTGAGAGPGDGGSAPIMPSAKAMGKRKALPGTDDMDEHSDEFPPSHARTSSDSSSLNSEDEASGLTPSWRKQPTKYVYDAAADRARDIRHELGIPSPTATRFPVNSRARAT